MILPFIAAHVHVHQPTREERIHRAAWEAERAIGELIVVANEGRTSYEVTEIHDTLSRLDGLLHSAKLGVMYIANERCETR